MLSALRWAERWSIDHSKKLLLAYCNSIQFNSIQFNSYCPCLYHGWLRQCLRCSECSEFIADTSSVLKFCLAVRTARARPSNAKHLFECWHYFILGADASDVSSLIISATPTHSKCCWETHQEAFGFQSILKFSPPSSEIPCHKTIRKADTSVMFYRRLKTLLFSEWPQLQY